jgi:hypothetical protein
VEEWLKRILNVMDLSHCAECQEARWFTLEDFRWLFQLSREEVAKAEEALEVLALYGCIERRTDGEGFTEYQHVTF